jgi:hypothetical protein
MVRPHVIGPTKCVEYFPSVFFSNCAHDRLPVFGICMQFRRLHVLLETPPKMLGNKGFPDALLQQPKPLVMSMVRMYLEARK